MKYYHYQRSPKCYVVDLTCNCNCFEGTEKECRDEINDLVNRYHHNPQRYTIRYTRLDY